MSLSAVTRIPPWPQLVRHLLLFFDKNRTSPWCCNIIINISIEQYHCHAKKIVILYVLDIGKATFQPQAINRNLKAEIWFILECSMF